MERDHSKTALRCAVLPKEKQVFLFASNKALVLCCCWGLIFAWCEEASEYISKKKYPVAKGGSRKEV